MSPNEFQKTTLADIPRGVRFDIPARNQGQIVEVAYGTLSRYEAGSLDDWMRIHDKSDRGTSYYRRSTAARPKTLADSKLTPRFVGVVDGQRGFQVWCHDDHAYLAQETFYTDGKWRVVSTIHRATFVPDPALIRLDVSARCLFCDEPHYDMSRAPCRGMPVTIYRGL